MRPSGDYRTSASGRCILISASCTTGWLDWIHGELWVCEGGLLRRSLGLGTTVGHFNGQTVDPRLRPSAEFSTEAIAAVVAKDPRNLWIAWPEIARAVLKKGIVDHSLHLDLDQGRRAKFLWLRSDGGFDIVKTRLESSLADRFSVVTRPIG